MAQTSLEVQIFESYAGIAEVVGDFAAIWWELELLGVCHRKLVLPQSLVTIFLEGASVVAQSAAEGKRKQ